MKIRLVLMTLLAILALTVCVCDEGSEGVVFDKEYVTVTYMTEDGTYFSCILEKGKTPESFYVPPVPEGYTGWDTDLSQPVYEDTVVHAIPGKSPLKAGIIVIAVILLMFAAYDLLSHWYMRR